MSEMKPLKEKQLEEVNGGGSYASDEYLPSTHGPHLCMSEIRAHKEAFLGKQFYCVMDNDPRNYAVVTLCEAYKYRGYINIHEIHNEFYDLNNKKCSVGTTVQYSVIYHTFYFHE